MDKNLVKIFEYMRDRDRILMIQITIGHPELGYRDRLIIPFIMKEE